MRRRGGITGRPFPIEGELVRRRRCISSEREQTQRIQARLGLGGGLLERTPTSELCRPASS